MAKMHFRFGSYEGALDLLRQLFERFSESRKWVEARVHTQAVFAAAVLLKHLGRYTEAADYLAHVAEAPPRPYDRVDVQVMTARVYEQMGGAKGMMTAAWKEAFELTRDRDFVRAERRRRAERRQARAMEA